MAGSFSRHPRHTVRDNSFLLPLQSPHHWTLHPRVVFFLLASSVRRSNGSTSGTRIRMERRLPVLRMQKYGGTCPPEKEEPGPRSWLLHVVSALQQRLRFRKEERNGTVKYMMYKIQHGTQASPLPFIRGYPQLHWLLDFVVGSSA